MSKLKNYIDSSPEFKSMAQRYSQFLVNLDKPGTESIRIFDPLSERALEELALIRDVSKYLQKKKEEDMNKAAQAAELAAEEAKLAEKQQKEEEPSQDNEEKKEE